MTGAIILASGSGIRQRLLRNAGVDFEVEVPRLDEAALRESMAAEGASPRDVADMLAEAKARKIALKRPGRFVLGCDQVLAADGDILGKPATRDEVRAQLDMLNGKTHELLAAAVVFEDAEPVWRHVGTARLTMRAVSGAYLDGYVARNWEDLRHTVGGYMVEREGVRLFRKIEGDLFHVLGIPLVETLAYLSAREAIEA